VTARKIPRKPGPGLLLRASKSGNKDRDERENDGRWRDRNWHITGVLMGRVQKEFTYTKDTDRVGGFA